MMGWVKMFPGKGKHYKTFAHHNLVQTYKKSKSSHLEELVNVSQYLGKRHYFQVPAIEWMSVYPHPHHRDSHVSLLPDLMVHGAQLWRGDLAVTGVHTFTKEASGSISQSSKQGCCESEVALNQTGAWILRSVGSKYPLIIWAPHLWFLLWKSEQPKMVSKNIILSKLFDSGYIFFLKKARSKVLPYSPGWHWSLSSPAFQELG